MAVNLFESVLSDKINISEFLNWLTNESLLNPEIETITSYGCGQGEFVVFFLNHLLDQTASVLSSDTSNPTPRKIQTPRRKNSFVENNHSITKIKNSNHSISKELFPSVKSDNLTLDEDNFPSLSNKNLISSTPDVQKKSYSNSEINSLDISDISESSTKNLSSKRPKSTSELSKSLKYSTYEFENDSKNQPQSFDKISSYSKSTSTPFCLGDFIVSSSTTEKQRSTKARKCILQNPATGDKTLIEHGSKLVSRRIKPTSIIKDQDSTDKNEHTVFGTNIGNIEPDPVFKVLSVKKDVCSSNDRDVLRAECLKLRQQNDPGGGSANQILLLNAPSKIVTKTDSNTNLITPKASNVTNPKILNIYVEIYSTMLIKNLVLNLANEMYFLFSLLLVRQVQNEYSDFCVEFEKQRNDLGTDSKPSGTDEYFQSVHNCVYFAVKVIQRICSTLKIFDRPTLKLLENNVRIKEFSAELNMTISDIYRQKVENNSNSQMELFWSKNCSGKNVCFISDTDNRSNFPNLKAFQTFRKQRDLFYEILQTWEANNLNVNWKFSSLEKSINVLMNMSEEPLNFLHLARLFKCQLLKDCGCFNNAFEEECLFSSTLKNINATKLSLLQSRLVTPQSGDNLSNFPGYQEFYQKFILSVNKPQFLRHLIDSFIAEIYQLHQDGFLFQDISLDDEIDSETKYKYTVTVLSLKLLGKFLSFIECLSYSTTRTELCSENLISIQILVRNKVQNQLNIKSFILDAIENRILILTIPWICDYFSQLDYVTIRLPSNKKILHILFEIYYRLPQKLSQNTSSSAICEKSTTSKLTLNNESLNAANNILNYIDTMPLESIFLLKLCIGSLFEKSHFPEELYFKWLTNQTNYIELYNARDFFADELNETNVDLTTLNCSTVQTNIRKLDLYRIVNEKILYKLCPQLAGIKQLLMNNEINSKIGKPCMTARHITPVTTLILNESVASKQLQLQMEETFFNLHPPSMRKTIDFVSERVTSICVKHICTTLVPNLKSKARQQLYDFIQTIKVEDQSKLEPILMKNAREIADNCLLELRSNYCPTILCDGRCRTSLNALLSPDLHGSVINFCVEYTSRQVKNKVLQWIEAHVVSDIFTKHLNNLIQSFITTSTLDSNAVEDAPTKEISDEVFENTITPVFAIDKTRKIIWKFTDGENPTLDSTELVQFLENISISISSRNDYTAQIHKETVYLTLDLALILLTFSPKIMSDKTVVSSFITIWKTYKNKSDNTYKEKLLFINTTIPVFSEDLRYRQDDLNETIAKKRQENRFSRMVCARNIFMLEQSQDPQSTWLNFGQLLFAMIKDDAIIPANALDAQCTAFFQLEWPQVILDHFKISLMKIIEDYKSWKETEDEFTLLLEFLAETCERLEDDSLEL